MQLLTGRPHEKLRDALFFWIVVKIRGKGHQLSKIILRPHFKKEKPKAFFGGWELEKQVGGKRRKEKTVLGMG